MKVVSSAVQVAMDSASHTMPVRCSRRARCMSPDPSRSTLAKASSTSPAGAAHVPYSALAGAERRVLLWHSVPVAMG
jgi:hypothetical protein